MIESIALLVVGMPESRHGSKSTYTSYGITPWLVGIYEFNCKYLLSSPGLLPVVSSLKPKTAYLKVYPISHKKTSICTTTRNIIFNLFISCGTFVANKRV